MKQFKRILCMLLAFTLVLGMVPMSVFAEEIETEPEATEAATENVSEAETVLPAEDENGDTEAADTEGLEQETTEDTEAAGEEATDETEEVLETAEEAADETEEASENAEEATDETEETLEIAEETADESEETLETADEASEANAEELEDAEAAAAVNLLAAAALAKTMDEPAEPMARGDKLTYNANAGGDTVSGMPNAQAANNDSIVYISTSIPSRTGYTFLGWATEAGAAEAEYYPGQKLTLDGDLTLYAVWQKSATLSYDGKGADTEVPAPETNVAGWIALAADAPTREGYRFNGWLGSDGNTYQPGDEIEVKEDLTLTAVWIKQVTLHFDANGGTLVRHTADDGKTFDAGETYSLMLQYVDATRDGYQFLGFKNLSTEEVYSVYRVGLTTLTPQYLKVTMDTDVTLQAVWGENFTLTFDGNADGDTTLKNVPKAVEGTYVRGSTTKPTRTGYTFLGWSYEKDGKDALTTDFTKSSYYLIDKNTTVYAQWSELTYTVKFDLNGGEGTVPADITYTSATKEGTVITVPAADGYTKEGCTLVGWSWNTKRADLKYNGKLSTADYAPGTEVPNSKLATPSKDTTYTIYAVWQKDEVVLTLVMSAGVKGPSGYPKSFSYGDTASLPLQGAGYKKTYTLGNGEKVNFGTLAYTIGNGYYCVEKDAFYKFGNMAAGAAGKILMDQDYTIIWVWKNYVVEYRDEEGAYLNHDLVEYGYGTGLASAVSIANGPEKENYTFKGWATTQGSTEVAYAPGASYGAMADIILYPVYELNKYTVTYSADDAETDVPDPAEYDALTEITVAAAPERTGYDFKGWDDGEGNVYQPGDTFELTKDVTLTAVWEAQKITITFDANAEDATLGSPATVTRNYGVNYTISTTATREHYELLGWAATADATEAEYTVGGKITLTENLTLYAVWQGVPVAVEFDANGGDPVDPIKAHYGDEITLPTASRENYNFLGWTTADETEYAAGDTFTVTEDIVFTAQWEKIVYTLHFDAQGGTTTKTDVEVDAGTTYRLNVSSGNATKEGFQFLGWDTDPNATEPEYYIYYAGLKTATNRYYTLTLEGNTTLYAIWGNKYHLVVDGNLEGKDVRNLQNNNNASTYGTWVYWSNYKPTCSGYTFVKWTYDAAGTQDASDDFKTNGWYKIDKDTTLYAQWTAITYTVSFDLNGGEGTVPESIEYTLDTVTDINLPAADGYTKEGRIFIGWSFGTKIADQTYKVKSISDLNNTQKKNAYEAGATIPASALGASNKTVYAIWAKIEVKLTIITTGGLKPLTGYPKSFSYGDTASLPLQTVSQKKTYTLGNGETVKFGTLAYTTGNGYYCKETGAFYKMGNMAAGAAGKILMDKDYELIWVWKSYVVEYRDDEGAYLNYDLVEYGYGTGLASAVSIANGPEKENFTFKGWATTQGSTEVAYAPGASYGAMEDIILYAVYEPIVYTVTYVNENDEQIGEALSVNAGDSFDVAEGPKVENKKFIAWTAEDETTYEAGETVTPTGDLTLKATYKELTKVEAADATCEDAGNIEYWFCEEDETYYADAYGEEDITEEDTVIDALGHKLEKIEAVDASCEEDGNIEYYKCSVCEKLFADENGEEEITEEDTVIEALGHKLEKIEAADPKCEEDGNIEYYKCSVCEKLFADANGEEEITEEETLVPALEHDPAEAVKENYVAPTATKNGSYDLVVYCSRCDKELSRETVVIPATGEPTTDTTEAAATAYRLASFGPKFKDVDENVEDDKARFTTIDLTQDGEYTFALVANDAFDAGIVVVTVKDGKVKVELKLKDGFTLEDGSCYILFADIASADITAEGLKTFQFDTEYSIADDLAGDTDLILYVNATAAFEGDTASLAAFNPESEENVKLVNDMLEHIGK